MSPVALSLLAQIVIAWVAISVVVAAIFGVMAARLQGGRRFNDRGRRRDERRSGLNDRRIGLPDTRPQPVERRRGPRDRRAANERYGRPSMA